MVCFDITGLDSTCCRQLQGRAANKTSPAQLGTKAGAEEIKSHPFFEGVNWALLRQQKPPYVPRRAAAADAGAGEPAGAAAAGGKGANGGFDNY